MSSVNSARRYYLLKRLASRDLGDGHEGTWRSKQEGAPGAALPPTFPCITRLAAAGYSTREDLTGAAADELMKRAGLTRREANAALAALETA